MKKLLYIGNHLSQKGKTETTIETLSKFLRKEGFTVKMSSNKVNKVLRLIDMVFSILKYSKKVDYVLIDTYSTNNFYFAYVCSAICRRLKLKYIPILHGGNLPERLLNSPKMSQSIFKYSYKNVAPSNYTKIAFENLGYTNIVCIPNVIKIKNYPYYSRHFQNIRLLWVRSFSKIYNPNLAIDILKSLKNDGFDVELCMVGPEIDGSMWKAKIYAEELGVKVKFAGKLPKEEWIALSKDYNIFINTTNFDNMPVSVIEAMALGLPVITTNVGGMPFLIENNHTGLLVKPNSVSVFVEGIKQLIKDEKKTNEMTSNARQLVENFDWNVVKKQWFNTLH